MVDRTRDSYRDDDSMPMPMLKLHERAPGKLPPQPEDRHQPVLQGILLGDARATQRRGEKGNGCSTDIMGHELFSH